MRAFVLSHMLAGVLFVAPAAAQTPSRFEGRLVTQDGGVPVAGASVSIVGMTGSARTDNDGRFTWAPAPPVPFQMIVVLAGGQVARPVIVDALQEGTTAIQLKSLTDEAVTVLGAAPSINDGARRPPRPCSRARTLRGAIPRTSCRRSKPSRASTRSPKDMPRFPRSVGLRAAGRCS